MGRGSQEGRKLGRKKERKEGRKKRGWRDGGMMEGDEGREERRNEVMKYRREE